MLFGEMKIYDAVGWDAPLRFTCVYDATEKDWFATTTFLREDGAPIILGREPLKDFPSEMLIAQCMLVC